MSQQHRRMASPGGRPFKKEIASSVGSPACQFQSSTRRHASFMRSGGARRCIFHRRAHTDPQLAERRVGSTPFSLQMQASRPSTGTSFSSGAPKRPLLTRPASSAGRCFLIMVGLGRRSFCATFLRHLFHSADERSAPARATARLYRWKMDATFPMYIRDALRTSEIRVRARCNSEQRRRANQSNSTAPRAPWRSMARTLVFSLLKIQLPNPRVTRSRAGPERLRKEYLAQWKAEHSRARAT